MHYIYVLFSLKDKKFYVGKTTNLFNRLEKHNKGWVKSTKDRRPLILVHCEVYKAGKEAFLRERELKYPSAGKFKKQLKEKFDL